MSRGRRTDLPLTVFRLDFGGTAGWGHLTRCAALAGELKRNGWQCALWTDGDLANVPAELRAPFSLTRAAGAAWAACPPSGLAKADWVVVDTYAADDEMLRTLQRSLAANAAGARVPGLVVLDDEEKRQLDCAAFVINARPGLTRSAYGSSPAVALVGEEYALLRPELLAPAPVVSPFGADRIPVLVMLGGTDPRGLTCEVLRVLAETRQFVPVVVHGRRAECATGVMPALDGFPDGVWLESVDAANLAAWVQICRYAVSAAGGTLYELALLRLPFVAMTVAPNQVGFGAAVARHWNLPVVAADANLRINLIAAMRRLIAAHPPCASAERRAFSAVDGKGAARVAQHLAVGF